MSALDPNGLMSQATQQSGLLQQNALQQTLMGSKGDQLARMLYAPTAVPDAPRLTINTDPQSTGSGIVGGLGDALNNAMQMGQYRQANAQRQSLMDLARQRDLAAQAEAQKKAQKEAEFVSTLPEGLRSFYQQSDDIGRRAILTDLAQPFLGAPRGQGQGAEQAAKVDTLIQKRKPTDIGGVPQPANIDYNRALLGSAPTTAADLNKQALEIKKAQNELGAQPALLKEQLLGAHLENSIKAVTAKYAESKAALDKLVGEGELEKAEEMKTKLSQGEAVYNHNLTNYAQLTPGQVKLFNSQMKSNKMPFELPEKDEKTGELKAVTEKGKVKQFYDATTGQVYNIDPKTGMPVPIGR